MVNELPGDPSLPPGYNESRPLNKRSYDDYDEERETKQRIKDKLEEEFCKKEEEAWYDQQSNQGTD